MALTAVTQMAQTVNLTEPAGQGQQIAESLPQQPESKRRHRGKKMPSNDANGQW